MITLVLTTLHAEQTVMSAEVSGIVAKIKLIFQGKRRVKSNHFIWLTCFTFVVIVLMYFVPTYQYRFCSLRFNLMLFKEIIVITYDYHCAITSDRTT